MKLNLFFFAAKATLSILIPEMSKLIEKQVEEEEDLSVTFSLLTILKFLLYNIYNF